MLVARAGSSEWVQRNFRFQSLLTPGSEAVSHNTAKDIVVISFIIATNRVLVTTGYNCIHAMDLSFFYVSFLYSQCCHVVSVLR